MRKIIATSIVCVMIGFLAGFEFNDWYFNNSQLFEANQAKKELIKAQADALDAADKVMDNNELLDTDGSDDMADYLNKAAIVDKMYESER